MPEINEKINLLCPYCNAKLTFTTNIIRHNPTLKCPKCKQEMNIRTDLDKRLKEMEKKIEKLIKDTTIKMRIK